MHNLAHRGSHRDCSPKGWHSVPIVTGDYDFDASIMHKSNRDMPARLRQHLATSNPRYTPRTAYHGYSGNHGDE
jgi:hypothetical protein